MLKIAGDSDLLQETVLLKEVVARHPFGEYFRPIRCVELRCDENGPRIDLSSDDRVILTCRAERKHPPNTATYFTMSLVTCTINGSGLPVLSGSTPLFEWGPKKTRLCHGLMEHLYRRQTGQTWPFRVLPTAGENPLFRARQNHYRRLSRVVLSRR